MDWPFWGPRRPQGARWKWRDASRWYNIGPQSGSAFGAGRGPKIGYRKTGPFSPRPRGNGGYGVFFGPAFPSRNWHRFRPQNWPPLRPENRPPFAAPKLVTITGSPARLHAGFESGPKLVVKKSDLNFVFSRILYRFRGPHFGDQNWSQSRGPLAILSYGLRLFGTQNGSQNWFGFRFIFKKKRGRVMKKKRRSGKEPIFAPKPGTTPNEASSLGRLPEP